MGEGSRAKKRNDRNYLHNVTYLHIVFLSLLFYILNFIILFFLFYMSLRSWGNPGPKNRIISTLAFTANTSLVRV